MCIRREMGRKASRQEMNRGGEREREDKTRD